MRTYDLDVVMAATEQCRDTLGHVDFNEWLLNDSNVALQIQDDVGLFENQLDFKGTVAGHYFFKSRGKAAMANAKQMITEVFTLNDINRIIGLTPLDNKGALWMTTQLGFTNCGNEDIRDEPHRVSQLLKTDWSN